MTKPENELQKIPVQAYFTEEDFSMLEKLREQGYPRLSKSDLIRFLVSKEFERVFRSEKIQPEAQP